MTYILPPHPSLEHLKKQAKELLRAHAHGRADVCDVLCRLHRFTDATVADMLGADVSLTEVQFALALAYGFSSWTALKVHVEGIQGHDHLLHIHCGDSSADSLRKSAVGGKVITWYDPLVEGPTPAGVSPEDWLRLRARNLLSFFETEAQAAQALQGMDAHLFAYRDFAETVLWFDACLFDQLILIRQLDWFAQQNMDGKRLSLICIGAFAGHSRFHGLGELKPEELASLLDTRQVVSSAEIALATRAWAAYRAPDPLLIERLLSGDTAALPFLGPALVRHLERFPSSRNGLSRLESEALTAIAAGHLSLWGIMKAASELEYPAFFGDSYLFAVLESLTEGPRPLLTEHGLASYRHLQRSQWPIDKSTYGLTKDGIAVMEGSADWIALRGGIDRWLGGVHLQGPESPWRWDEEGRRLVRG